MPENQRNTSPIPHHMNHQIKLSTLQQQSLENLLDNHWEDEDIWHPRQILSSLKVPGTELIYLTANQKQHWDSFILGRTLGEEAEILFLFVHPNFRRQGRARELMMFFFKSLQAKRINRCFLEVNPKNQSAINLYTKAGFSTIGTRKNYYKDGSPCWVMERNHESII